MACVSGRVGLSYYIFSNTVYASSTQGLVQTGETYITCLLGDALIETSVGLVKIQDISVGDQVSTPSGFSSVRFVGKSTRHQLQLMACGLMPVLIRAGALGELGPSQDIHCTPSHAFLISGCLVEAKALINGNTIQQLQRSEESMVTVYSIELEQHDLVWANGLLTETYYASAYGKGFSRECWDNYADYVALYGEGNLMQELALPRIPFARQLPAVIRHLVGVPDLAEAEAGAALYALN